MVLELTAVGLAVAGVLLLQRRGLTIDDSGVARFDPFLAAVPLLVGFAAAVILIRTYPYPVQALASLAAPGAISSVLGLRTIGRRPSGAALPLLILMVTTAFGAFSATIMNSLERGQIVASWMAVGADYRIDTNVRGIGDLQALSLPGVESAAPAFVDPDAVFEGRPGVGHDPAPCHRTGGLRGHARRDADPTPGRLRRSALTARVPTPGQSPRSSREGRHPGQVRSGSVRHSPSSSAARACPSKWSRSATPSRASHRERPSWSPAWMR